MICWRRVLRFEPQPNKEMIVAKVSLDVGLSKLRSLTYTVGHTVALEMRSRKTLIFQEGLTDTPSATLTN